MEDFRKDEIIYDEDWKQFDEPVLVENDKSESVIETAEKEVAKPEKRKRVFPSLVTIQLIVCLLIAFLVFMLKAMNSDTYAQLCKYYDELMQKTLLSSSVFEDIDLSKYFESTADEVIATNDEV